MPDRPPARAQAPAPSARPGEDAAEAALLSLIAPVLVAEGEPFAFDGAVARTDVRAAWRWLGRDVGGDLPARISQRLADGVAPAEAAGAVAPAIVKAIAEALEAAAADRDADRRLSVQLGGEEARARLPVFCAALRHRALIEKAVAFGTAANAMADDQSLGNALQAIPLRDPAVTAFLMQAMVGRIANPSRLFAALARVVGDARESSILHAGYGPLVEAVLAHAQDQLLPAQAGVFADVDLVCRRLDRFHRLLRAVNGFVTFARPSRWAEISGTLIRTMSTRLEPRLREVSADVSQSLRRPREGADRLDRDRLLSALGGMYLLATVRDCRDSLALNAVFDKAWSETGQALEVLVARNMEAFRADPDDAIAGERLDMGIKMAEIRFNAEYAGILRRAREAAARRAG